MAKSKKQQKGSGEGDAEKKPAAKKPAPKKETRSKQSGGAGEPLVPSIDTNLAAASAAAMIAQRAVDPATGQQLTRPQPEAKKESAAFRQLKQGLAKPPSLGGALGAMPGQKKSNAPFAGGNQVGRNQTFGADVNRSGVPRRTGG